MAERSEVMSPTEHDLRAALRDGEGDGPDPDRLIALGQAHQARRRMQMLSTAVAVVVIAGAGTGIVALARSGSGDKTNADSAVHGAAGERLAVSAPGGSSGAGAGAGGASSAALPAAAGSQNAGKAAGVGCPATLPRYVLPGGGSPGQFGADEPLFDRPVTSVIVCSYDVVPAPSGAPLAPARVALSGASARRLAASLNGAAAAPATLCPKRDLTASARDLAIIGLAADGTPLHTITVTRSASACADSQVTNGTAVRYNWTPPSDLRPILAALTPTAIPKMHGSPISS
jgi:hypothetical protein